MADKIVNFDEAQLAAIIQQYQPDDTVEGSAARISGAPLRQAAVLILFVRQDQGWHLLFIRRSDQVADHKGQVAFPGGGIEDGDGSPVETALRETSEEIGVDPRDVRVFGELDRLLTGTGYIITPVVGTVAWPYALHLSSDEVDKVFTIPLSWLADPVNREERPHPFRGEQVKVIYYRPYLGEILWGVSARITANLLKVLSI